MKDFFKGGESKKGGLFEKGGDKYPLRTMMFSYDHFRKILQAFHIVDNSIIPASHDLAYRPSVRGRPVLDYMNNVCMHYFCSGQAFAINESLVAGKVFNPI